MVLPEGIGPHEGRELILMLEGKKPCAIFSDILPAAGQIPEEIIPEVAFAPYVAQEKFLRFSKDFIVDTGHVIHCVCFTQTDQAWRASVLFWLKERLYSGIKSDDTDDAFEGRVLGYDERQITAYLAHKNSKP